jgi:DNA-binding MarR family transcriptional regulator
MFADNRIENIDNYTKDWPGINRTALHTAMKALENTESIHYNISCHLGTFGVSKSRLMVLDALFFSSEQGLTPAELADRVHITRPSMTTCLDGLEKSSYIRRVPSSSDRRTLLIQITNEGRTYIESEIPRLYTFFSQIFSNLSQSEQKTLIDILNKVNDSTKNYLTEDHS